MRRHDFQFCPSCGEAGSPNTLDHYLPKGKYPHFAVTPANLTPMCFICQIKKGEDVGDHINPKFFIHPYFDNFASEQLLILNISPPFDIPTFSLDISPNLTAEQAALVTAHIDHLNIRNRYIKFFRDRYLALLRNANQARGTNINFRDVCEMNRTTYANKGNNYWDHIFLHSAMRNDDLMDYLENGILPDHL